MHSAVVPRMTEALNAEQLREGDRVLALINEGTRRLGAGIDALLLKYRWQRLGDAEGELAEWLDQLNGDGLIQVLRKEPLSLRLTADGLQRLRQVSGIGGTRSPSTRSRGFRFRSERSEDGGTAQARLSELTLRMALVDLLAALGVDEQRSLRAGSALLAWTGNGRRDEGLRLAMGICERDGYLRLRRNGDGTLVNLTAHGVRYGAGRSSPDSLVDRAPALDPQQLGFKVLAEDEYLLLTAQRLTAAGFSRDFSLSDLAAALREARLPDTAVTRCADLMYRYGFVEIPDPAWLQFRLTDSGRELMQRGGDADSRAWVQTALAAATRKEQSDD